jgi:predicted transcriptional regulator
MSNLEGTTTVRLSEGIQRDLQALAEQQRKTTNEVVQEAIQFYLVSSRRKQPESIGLGKSDVTDLSERVDELLWQES